MAQPSVNFILCWADAANDNINNTGKMKYFFIGRGICISNQWFTGQVKTIIFAKEGGCKNFTATNAGIPALLGCFAAWKAALQHA
jgi:hypothetical protein